MAGRSWRKLPRALLKLLNTHLLSQTRDDAEEEEEKGEAGHEIGRKGEKKDSQHNTCQAILSDACRPYLQRLPLLLIVCPRRFLLQGPVPEIKEQHGHWSPLLTGGVGRVGGKKGAQDCLSREKSPHRQLTNTTHFHSRAT
ncbi:unnamed protein product [Pleuronectes platessa]|uniref:Uncharacterized protein n=1 Tax=Pleuronectes platessa TaxID=8262 RepID=A0A9N7VSL2_PLEPL|nr:unnamed protein product [Pleuronectes platessa]